MVNGKIHYKRPFSIAILNYQRVTSQSLNCSIFRFQERLLPCGRAVVSQISWPPAMSQLRQNLLTYVVEGLTNHEPYEFYHVVVSEPPHECEDPTWISVMLSWYSGQHHSLFYPPVINMKMGGLNPP